MRVVFWAACALVIYIYAIYPLVIWVAGLFVRSARTAEQAEFLPALSIIITAYNEGSSLKDTLARIGASDYPAGLVEFIVVSDGSTDGTASEVNNAQLRNVHCVEMTERVGKTAAQEIGVDAARGEILVFTDANSHIEPDALALLVEPFRDPKVGSVCGSLKYHDPEQGVNPESRYWSYELLLRRLESRLGVHCVTNGALYAVRRAAYIHLAPDIISDFIEPLAVHAKGWRIHYQEDAVTTEFCERSVRGDFVRKRRVVLGGMTSLWRARKLIALRSHPLLFFEIASHKILRWLSPVLFLLVVVTSLAGIPLPARIVVMGVAGSVSFAGAIALARGHTRGFQGLCAYVLTTIGATLLAIVDLLRGKSVTSWETDRS